MFFRSGVAMPRVIPTHLRFKKKTAYAVLSYKPYQYCILCCCQFLTAILFYCNAAMLFGTLQASFLVCKEPTKTQSIAIKKTVIPTATTIPLLQYKNCQKHT
jgi:hypothetical protein